MALPAREMFADMLLELNRPEEALAEYEQSMKVDLNRLNGLYGAARAAELSHQPDKARSYYATLVKNCEGLNSDRPELARARAALEKKETAAKYRCWRKADRQQLRVIPGLLANPVPSHGQSRK